MFKKTENSALLPIGVLLVALLKAPFGETIIAVNKNKPRITKEAVKYLFNCSSPSRTRLRGKLPFH